MSQRRKRNSQQHDCGIAAPARDAASKKTYSSRKRPRNSNSNAASLISPLTFQSSAFLLVAIIAGLLWNYYEDHFGSTATDSDVRAFLKQVCSESDVECHLQLQPVRRTQQSLQTIKRGETVLKIPRRLQIWDEDAIKNEWIRDELVEPLSDSGISRAAFFAAYLARLAVDPSSLSPVLQAYMTRVLPSYEDYYAYHALFWTEDDSNIPPATKAHLHTHRRVIEREYQTFARVSTPFANEITPEAYWAARLHVLTRSFGTTIESSDGSFALVPVLDLYDHHAHPNVEFSYQSDSFVIRALSDIQPGHQVMDSYGKRTDSDLLARFGFVNGDGSGWTEGSIAFWHTPNIRLVDTSIVPPIISGRERATMLRYLQYDDGYAQCVKPTDNQAWVVKRLKLQLLLRLAADSKYWIVHMSPLNPTALPGHSTTQVLSLPPKLKDWKKMRLDATHVFALCRVLVLTHEDYHGEAREALENALSSEEAVALPKDDTPSSLLEFRTQLCVARLATSVLQRVGTSSEDAWLALSRHDFGTRDWTLAHVRYGEIQTLTVLRELAFASMRSSRRSKEDALMRNDPCPPETMIPLLKDTE